jgi:hypothetical protein
MAARKSKTAELEPLVGSGLGRVAYESYVAATDQKSALDWERVLDNHDVAAAWCAAAQAVITATIERNS